MGVTKIVEQNYLLGRTAATKTGIFINNSNKSSSCSLNYIDILGNNTKQNDLKYKSIDSLLQILQEFHVANNLTNISREIASFYVIKNDTYADLPSCIFTIKCFEIELWDKINSLISANKKETALVTILLELNENLNDIDRCNDFIIYSVKQNVNTDILLHILNALSPISQELSYWVKFVDFSCDFLIKQEGEETAKILLRVID